MNKTFRVTITSHDAARLQKLANAMNEEFNDGRIRDIEYVAQRALILGIDELERIFQVKRPAKCESRDDYEKHEQQSRQLGF